MVPEQVHRLYKRQETPALLDDSLRLNDCFDHLDAGQLTHCLFTDNLDKLEAHRFIRTKAISFRLYRTRKPSGTARVAAPLLVTILVYALLARLLKYPRIPKGAEGKAGHPTPRAFLFPYVQNAFSFQKAAPLEGRA